ncbi:hypothetical protein C7N43_09005 [Sphingobacteriales bacterium UPWRP_1]|nr:hypothetical protein B6N25_08670 [Sphingobacteriales bacterium TSM_CSS]PSJ77362.1 hypothetical protein C7N43_09005 [Sphingobacteriales bacterium UPWRP_1]
MNKLSSNYTFVWHCALPALCVFFFLLTVMGIQTYAQTTLSIVPPSCYTPTTPAAQDALAAADVTGNTPYGTWRAMVQYAQTHPSVTTLNFAQGTYLTNMTGSSLDWGTASTGYVIPANVAVNGNGALIDNTPLAGTSQVCFASLSSGSTLNNFKFKKFSGNTAGAVNVPATATGWTISNCTFDNCNLATDALKVALAAAGTGTITGCSFINNSNPLAYNPATVGTATASALSVTGTLTSDLNIINSAFRCNFRNTSGGAVQIHDDVHVDFDGCTFAGNEANASAGGAVSIQNNAVVSFNNTFFTCNFTSGGTTYDGGALDIESGSNVTITGSNFKSNGSPDATWTASADTRYGGAIYAAGAAASLVTLTISNTIFDGNVAGTGAGIYLNDANTTLTNNYFTANDANAEGGGVFVAEGNNLATLSFSNNTFTGNNASGSCTGIDVFTEAHINGANNDLQFLADGHHLSNNPGSLQFNNGGGGDRCNTFNATNWPNSAGTVSSNGDRLLLSSAGASFHYANRQETAAGATNKLYWTFTLYTANTFSLDTRYMAYCLGGTSSDFTTGNGFAIVKGRDGTSKIEFCSFTNGLDNSANFTAIQLFATPANEDGYIAFKVMYDPVAGNWTFWWSNSNSGGDVPANESDPRGFYWCGTSSPSTITANVAASFVASPFFMGPVYKGASSNQVFVNSAFFRSGDETSGTGWSGTYTAATCSTCLPSTPAVTNLCPLPAAYNISGTLFHDTDGLTDSSVDGTGIGTVSATQMYANLVQGGSVVQSITLPAGGTYTFTGLSAGSYTVVIATSATATTPSVPAGWVNVGEAFGSNNGAGTGNEGGTPNGSIAVTVGSADVTGVNFGIEQPPVAGTATSVTQSNPGGTTSVRVDNLLTSGSAPIFSASDPDGTVSSITITVFPTNATSISINGITYTSGMFPGGGVNVPTNGSGVPTQIISVDPVDGNVSVDISYTTTDAAGIVSNTGTATVPFGASCNPNQGSWNY